jgi:calcineurin-like phosphoesterase family protein
MVGWYDPSQLAQTGVKVAVSTVFGRHADSRLIEALNKPIGGAPYYDHTAVWVDDPDGGEHPRTEIWIDYVADTGDGWNSTYAIASVLAQSALTVQLEGGQPQRTTRGDLLVFGGDEVYPTASRSEYKQRLVAPYEAALRHTEPPHPHGFAVPGNHDWYDSLVSFTRLFCAQRWFGGWRTQQERSYFAIKLPQKWWLLGTDVQLGSDVDDRQIEYFRRVATYFADDDQIILCNAEPHWIYSAIYADYDAAVYNEGNLAFLERQVLGKRVSVFLAGDLHHYRRHEAADGTQKITAGGGGAFLHPTHGLDAGTIEERDDKGQATGRLFKLKQSWPPVQTSRRLCWRNLFFPYWNPRFGVAPAGVYVLIAWTVLFDLSKLRNLGAVLETLWKLIPQRPSVVLLTAAFLGAFVVFTDTHSPAYRWIAGLLHGAAHLLAIVILGWGAAVLTGRVLNLEFSSAWQLLIAGAVIFAGGWFVSGVIMGLYLLISLNVFKRHSNEAFSALRIEGWKHFLRLHVDRSGALTIFPIGVARIPRQWVRKGDGIQRPQFAPADGATLNPVLIEPPIVVR